MSMPSPSRLVRSARRPPGWTSVYSPSQLPPEKMIGSSAIDVSDHDELIEASLLAHGNLETKLLGGAPNASALERVVSRAALAGVFDLDVPDLEQLLTNPRALA